MTNSGMFPAISEAKSQLVRPTSESTRVRAWASMRCSSRPIRLGLNTWLTSFRSRVWSGGSRFSMFSRSFPRNPGGGSVSSAPPRHEENS